eukprot:TRINITY_DN3346_c2_g1_i3.p1 TRINITY_DN3346_c2_g1~~TRINITY_DN3346_c2_g1_i3.p1  ORF type:complete len:157 (-),score=5.93 TRINITY_DN3346_c2_g1_i3:54-524(-)
MQRQSALVLWLRAKLYWNGRRLSHLGGTHGKHTITWIIVSWIDLIEIEYIVSSHQVYILINNKRVLIIFVWQYWQNGVVSCLNLFIGQLLYVSICKNLHRKDFFESFSKIKLGLNKDIQCLDCIEVPVVMDMYMLVITKKKGIDTQGKIYNYMSVQ